MGKGHANYMIFTYRLTHLNPVIATANICLTLSVDPNPESTGDFGLDINIPKLVVICKHLESVWNQLAPLRRPSAIIGHIRRYNRFIRT